MLSQSSYQQFFYQVVMLRRTIVQGLMELCGNNFEVAQNFRIIPE